MRAIRFLLLKMFAAAASLPASASFADELIHSDFIASKQDMYLILSSIKPVPIEDHYFAVSYMSLYEPKDRLEKFDQNFNVVGYEFIGNYQSVASGQIFDCRNGLEATLWTNHYSGRSPKQSELIKNEELESYYSIPLDPKLLSRVCQLGREKFD